MASAAPAPHPTCAEMERLFRDFKSVSQQLIRIHVEEIEAAAHQNLNAALALHLELRQARERRDKAAQDLKRHIREHCCW